MHGLAIQLRGVGKRYAATAALDGIDLTVQSSEFLTLLGPSGSGKTTLLNILAGFEQPDAGTVWFGDSEVSRIPPHRREIGVVFQSLALFPHMDVRDNVAYPLKLRRVAKATIDRKVDQALDLVRLSGMKDRRTDQLSGGQRQRVAIARAIVFEPRVLLMDEPLSALDKKLREEMQIEVRQLHDTLGTTTIYVTHDQREALTMSDRVAVLNAGRLVQVGDPETVHERPSTRFVADFIGESYVLPLSRRGAHLHFGSTAIWPSANVPETGDMVLVVRPEKLFTVAGPQTDVNVLEIRVDACAYQGDSQLVLGTTGDGHRIGLKRPWLQARERPLAPGSRITVGLHPSDTLVLPADGAAAPWMRP